MEWNTHKLNVMWTDAQGWGESALRWPARTDQLIPLLQVLGCVLISWACQGLPQEWKSKPLVQGWSRLWLLILCKRQLKKYRFGNKKIVFTRKGKLKCIIELLNCYIYTTAFLFLLFALLCGIFSIMGKLWFSAFSVLIWCGNPSGRDGVRPKNTQSIASVYPAKH